MRFFRFAVYAGVIATTIVCWEYGRESFFGTVKNISSEIDAKEASPVTSAEAVQEADEETEDDEAEVKEEIQQEKPEHLEKSLFNFEKGFEDVAKGAMHSVVNVATMQIIENEGSDSFFENSPFEDLFKDFFDFPQKKQSKPRKAHALGSGFIVKVTKDKAFIVTNNHVIDKAKKVVVYLSDKTELPAEIHATDQRTDIAVLSVNLKEVGIDPKLLNPIQWGDSDNMNEGNWVIAIGNPFGLGSTVTTGIVSAKGRNIPLPKSSLNLVDDFIQHSAPINMGNSGGCLLDIHGNVIGINNAIFSTSGGNIGIGFAIPSNVAKPTVDQLIEHKRTYRGWLGAEVQAVGAKQAESVGLIEKTLDSSKIYGAFVARLVPNGPAEKAGVKVGDIITEFDGTKISEKKSLTSIVSMAKINTETKIKVWRHDEEKWGEKVLTIVVGDFEQAIEKGVFDENKDSIVSSDSKEEATIEELGITIAKLPESRRDGYPNDVEVVVVKVDDSKINSFFGSIFELGDGIISANNQKIKSVEQFRKVMESVKNNPKMKGKQVPFMISRGRSLMFLATTIDFSDSKADSKSEEKIEQKTESKAR